MFKRSATPGWLIFKRESSVSAPIYWTLTRPLTTFSSDADVDRLRFTDEPVFCSFTAAVSFTAPDAAVTGAGSATALRMTA